MVNATVLLVATAVLLGDQLLEPLLHGCLREVEIAEEGVGFDAFVQLKESNAVAARRVGVLEELNEKGVNQSLPVLQYFVYFHVVLADSLRELLGHLNEDGLTGL